MPTVAPLISYEWEPSKDPMIMADRIYAVEQGLRDRTMPMLATKQYVQEDLDRRFKTKVDPHGRKWQEWAESYEDYAKSYPGNQGILWQTGELHDKAIDDKSFIVTNDGVLYDTTYIPQRGWWHQHGAPQRRTKGGTPNPLPKREFLGLSTTTKALIMQTFYDWFDRSIQLFNTSTGKIGRRHAVQGVHPETGHAGFVPRESVGLKPMMPRP